jgi:hypothetical protein
MSSSSVSGVVIGGTVKVAVGVLAAGKTNGVWELEEEAAAFGEEVGANSIFPTGDDEGLGFVVKQVR